MPTWIQPSSFPASLTFSNSPLPSSHAPRLTYLSCTLFQVEWSDINAALGQSTLLLCTVVDRAGFQFQQYRLQPMGSFSKIVKVRGGAMST